MKRPIKLKDFTPATILVVKRTYNEKGYETTKELGQIPAVKYFHRIPKDLVPEGFHKMSVRGTDWSECDSLDELLELCEQHRESLARHMSREEYEQAVKNLKAGERPEETDEFMELHSNLNNALLDEGAPAIEGYEQMLARNVLVNHDCDIITDRTFESIRKEFGVEQDREIDIETGETEEENCGIWEKFTEAFTKQERRRRALASDLHLLVVTVPGDDYVTAAVPVYLDNVYPESEYWGEVALNGVAYDCAITFDEKMNPVQASLYEYDTEKLVHATEIVSFHKVPRK